MKKKIVTGLIIATLFGGCLFGLNAPKMDYLATAEKYTIETQTDLSAIRYGTSFTMPESVKIVVDENTKIDATDGRLIFPSGIVYGKGTHLLNEIGEYTLTYYAEHAGETIAAEEKFIIANKQWTVSSIKSSATYGDLTGFGATIKSNGQDVSWADGKQGIRLSLAEGDKFTYNVPLNIYEMGNVVDLFKIYPDMRETAETASELQNSNTVKCSYVTVRLVDVYDKNNYVEFLLWGDKIAFYNSAGWSGQSPVGLEACDASSTGELKMEYEGAYYHKHVITRYAKTAQWGVNSRAWTSKELVVKGGFNAQWDMTTNKIYSFVENNSKLITDLDDPLLHDENVFQGFSTGEVFVEIQPQVYSDGQNIEIEIEELLGLSGEELADTDYVDTVAPIVELQTQETDDMGVYASKNEEIVIPECRVRDLNFQGDLKANVYYNYASEEKITVQLKDGKFTPTQCGTYTLVYTATDSFGNKGYATMQYNVIDEKPFNYAEEKVNGVLVGEWNTLPTLSVKGNNLQPIIATSVVDPKGNKCEVEDSKFFAGYLGEYTITYEIKDNVYAQYYTYKASTGAESGVYFYDEPILPKYLVKDATYDIFALPAYTISADGKVPHMSIIYVSVDDGEFVKLTEETKAEYTVKANKSVQFEYRYQNASKRSEKISVLNVDYAEKNKNYAGFFVGDYTQQVGQSSQMDFRFNGSKTTGYVELITPILFDGLTFTFIVPEELANYSSITVEICDYANLQTTNTVIYEKIAQGVNVKVNGAKAQKLKDVFADTYSIQIDGDQIVLDNTARFSVNAFESRVCLLKISVGGIDAESVLSLKEVNGNRLREKTREADLVIGYDAPVGTYSSGTTYTTSTAMVNGAFTVCLESATKITVSKDGEIVKDVNGNPIKDLPTTAQYTFNLDEVGAYTIEYVATVGKEKVREQAIVAVMNTVAPTITFEKGLSENKYVKVKAGTEYTFAAFEVSDNLTAKEELIVTVYVRNANFNTLQVGGTSTTFVYKGFYVIQVYCMDADGNYSTAYYNVLVE